EVTFSSSGSEVTANSSGSEVTAKFSGSDVTASSSGSEVIAKSFCSPIVLGVPVRLASSFSAPVEHPPSSLESTLFSQSSHFSSPLSFTKPAPSHHNSSATLSTTSTLRVTICSAPL
ncbi:hypothetical protein EGW08_015246, partial [Elysia chlorotica]